ncbi:MAG: ADP-ribosylglycohydrolase family protein [Elusimicrobia bacterium]|nr:ADP-ribosylglycohydrolase family protein [Elusimicrobiota bacterium]
MLGAIAGDVIGSVFEFDNVKRADFRLFSADSDFTDDSVLTFAVADCILNSLDYGRTIRSYARRYPGRGYGGRFKSWVASEQLGPYQSFGNGSAMRVSPVGFAFDTEERVLAEARRSAEVTHDHPEGIKGAQAVALAIFLARTTRDKKLVRRRVAALGYDLDRTLDQIRPGYAFDETCPGSVPEAVIAFLESEGYEDAVRKAVSLGGDSDTIACMAGSIAQAYYGSVPAAIEAEVRERLPEEFADILDRFNERFPPR